MVESFYKDTKTKIHKLSARNRKYFTIFITSKDKSNKGLLAVQLNSFYNVL